jgi:hypothetical protein
MKKVIALFVMSILLVSCGENEVLDEGMEVPVNEVQIEEDASNWVLSEDEINDAMDELFNGLDN